MKSYSSLISNAQTLNNATALSIFSLCKQKYHPICKNSHSPKEVNIFSQSPSLRLSHPLTQWIANLTFLFDFFFHYFNPFALLSTWLHSNQGRVLQFVLTLLDAVSLKSEWPGENSSNLPEVTYFIYKIRKTLYIVQSCTENKTEQALNQVSQWQCTASKWKC